MASWAPDYQEELARVQRERSDFADGCKGVNRDGFRDELFFERLASYDREIGRLTTLAKKQAA